MSRLGARIAQVSKVMGYGMDDRGSTPNGDVRVFSTPQRSDRFRANTASYPMSNGFFSGG
jgi:hypothetical protein